MTTAFFLKKTLITMRSNITTCKITSRLLSQEKFLKRAVRIELNLKVPSNKTVQRLIITSGIKKNSKDEIDDSALFVFTNQLNTISLVDTAHTECYE